MARRDAGISLAPLLTRLLEPADDLYKTTINFSRIYANRCVTAFVTRRLYPVTAWHTSCAGIFRGFCRASGRLRQGKPGERRIHAPAADASRHEAQRADG